MLNKYKYKLATQFVGQFDKKFPIFLLFEQELLW